MAVFPRAARNHGRLLVVAVDASLEQALEGSGDGARGGAVAGLVRSGLSIDLYGWRGATPERFWATVFEGRRAERSQPYGGNFVWSALATAGKDAVVVGLPGIGNRRQGVETEFAGVPLSAQFLGGSRGVVIEEARMTSGTLPWPYRDVADRVRQTARMLARHRWSSWISVRSGEREGLFKLYRSLSGRYYLTPCYETTVDEAAAGVPLRVQQPTWPADVDEPRALLEFAEDLSDRVFRFARAEIDRKWGLLVYFDSLPGAVARIGRGYRATVNYADATAQGRERLMRAESEAYLRFDHRVRSMLAAAGRDSCVALLVDLESAADWIDGAEKDELSPVARMTLNCGDRLHGRAEARIVDVAPTLAYLLGVPAPHGAGGSVIREVAEQVGRATALVADRGGSEAARDGVALTAQSLIELGGSAGSDAEVSSIPLR